MITFKRNIETKFGATEVEFTFDDTEGIWVGSTSENVIAIASSKDFDELEKKLVKMYEMGVIFTKIYESNPDKGKVEKKILKDFFTGDWWKLHKN
jgi:hypothetical protein